MQNVKQFTLLFATNIYDPTMNIFGVLRFQLDNCTHRNPFRVDTERVDMLLGGVEQDSTSPKKPLSKVLLSGRKNYATLLQPTSSSLNSLHFYECPIQSRNPTSGRVIFWSPMEIVIKGIKSDRRTKVEKDELG